MYGCLSQPPVYPCLVQRVRRQEATNSNGCYQQEACAAHLVGLVDVMGLHLGLSAMYQQVLSLIQDGALQVTAIFMAYIAFDFCWLYLYPTSVPSLANVILGHHLVTLALLSFPFRHRDFGHFTCWDGLTELNTWFLVVRRQWSYQRSLMNSLYWLTFIPLRLVLYPGLLVKFWLVLEGFPLSERLLVCTCQFLLCCFNFGVFHMSMARRAGKGTAKRTPLRPVEHAAVPDKASLMKSTSRPTNVLIRAHGGAVLR